MKNIYVDQIVKQEQNRIDGFINVAQKADYNWFQIPVILIEGKEPGPVLLLEACTHGDEQEGTEALIRIADKYKDGNFKGTIVGVPCMNAEAFSQFSRTSVTDGANLNRVYPGNTTSYITNRIAAVYEERIAQFVQYAITYHGGGQVLHLEPIVSFDSEESRKMAEAYNFKYVWKPLVGDEAPFTGYAACMFKKYGIQSICAEAGSQCSRLYDRETNIVRHFQGTEGVMACLGMIPDPGYEPVKDKQVVSLYYLHSKNGGIHKIMKKQNEVVKKGEVLNQITDLFGNVVEEIVAPFDGVVNGFWSVSVIRPGDWSSLYMKIVE